MSLMTSPAAIKARAFLRKTGFTKVAMRFLRARDYEALLTASMSRAVQPGMCIWDVGANIGFYSRLFADRGGPGATVYAFEPSQATRDILIVDLPANVTIIPVALADAEGVAWLDRNQNDNGATARVSESGTERIEIKTGDGLIASGRLKQPQFLKIDVEGHELNVLLGMPKALSNASLTDIFIEVHFAIFGRTNRDGAPSQIEALLKNAGFVISWVDQSHLHAKRLPA